MNARKRKDYYTSLYNKTNILLNFIIRYNVIISYILYDFFEKFLSFYFRFYHDILTLL